MLSRLNANRVHTPLLILQLFWKSFQGLWLQFSWVLSHSSSATLQPLHPACTQVFISSSLLNTDFFSSGTSTTFGPHSFTLPLFHSCTYVLLLWLISCDFYCKLCIPPFLQVFICPLPCARAYLLFCFYSVCYVTLSSLTVIDLDSNPFTSRCVLFCLRMCCIDIFIPPPLIELEHTGTLT